MNNSIKLIILFSFLCTTSTSANRYPLSGRSYMKMQYENMTWNSAENYIFFNDGFMIDDSVARFKLAIPVNGVIDLHGTAVLDLGEDLELGQSCKINIHDTTGYISGNGLSLILNNNLEIESGKSLEFLTDTLVDGRDNIILLGDGSQLIVDSNVTLTLKNLTLKTSTNMLGNPAVKTYLDSVLCLDNVVLALDDRFEFSAGNLCIHGNVLVQGDGEFIYTSTSECVIDSNSTLIFGVDTVFTYSPNSANRDLIIMRDSSSSLFLNGCTLQSTYTALRLTKGHLLLDNKVTFSPIDYYSSPVSTFTFIPNVSFSISSTHFEDANYVCTSAWSPDGKFIAISSIHEPDEMFIDIYEVYSDITINPVSSFSYYYGNVTYNYIVLDWSPNGKYLAVGGRANLDNGYASIFPISYTGHISSSVDTIPYMSSVRALKWSPNGNYLFVGGSWTENNSHAKIYPMYEDGTVGTSVADFGETHIHDVAWSPDGEFIAVAHTTGGNYTCGGYIYPISHDGSIGFTTASLLDGREAWHLDWSPSGSLLAAGSFGNGVGSFQAVEVYSIETDGAISCTVATFADDCYDLRFSPDERFLLSLSVNNLNFGTYVGDYEVEIYSISTTGLDLKYTITSILNTSDYYFYSSEWNPDNMMFSVFSGNYTGISSLDDNVHIYPTPYQYDDNYYDNYNYTSHGRYSTNSITDNSITFGNSSLGLDYNLNIDLLSGAMVRVYGGLNLDNV